MTTLLLAFVLWLAGAPVQVPSAIGTETISGRVIQGETQFPLPHARLELVREDYGRRLNGHEKPCKPVPDADDPQKHRYAMTDANGRFTFTEIVPGRYFLVAEHEGFLKTEWGQRGRFPLGAVLEIGAQDDTPLIPDNPGIVARGVGQAAIGTRGGAATAIGARRGGPARGNVQAGAQSAIGVGRSGMPRNLLQDLILKMYPAPAIHGRVHNEYGARLPAAIVQAYQFRFAPLNGRTLKSIRSVFTDDNGEYRLFWMKPGQYVVAAGYSDYVLQPWTEALRFTSNLPDADNGYPISYYNGVSRPIDAFPVSVNALASPVVDFSLEARPRFTVEVRFTGAPAPPDASIVFVPYGGDSCASLDYAISRKSAGAFEIRGVPRGLYLVMAMRGRDVLSELLPVNVDQTIRDYSLPIVPPVQLVVKVGGTSFDRSEFRVNLTRMGNELNHTVTAGPDENGSFRLGGVGPGSYYITADTPPGYYVANVLGIQGFQSSDGASHCLQGPTRKYAYLDEHGHLNRELPLAVPAVVPTDVPPECVTAFVALGGNLYGRVIDRSRTPVPGALVVGLPASSWKKFSDSKVSFTPPDRFLTATTDSDGRFVLRGAVIDTEYKLFSFEDLDPNWIYDPDFADRFPNRELFDVEQDLTRLTLFEAIFDFDVANGARRTVEQAKSATTVTYSGGPNGLCTANLLCVLKVIPADETQAIH